MAGSLRRMPAGAYRDEDAHSNHCCDLMKTQERAKCYMVSSALILALGIFVLYYGLTSMDVVHVNRTSDSLKQVDRPLALALVVFGVVSILVAITCCCILATRLARGKTGHFILESKPYSTLGADNSYPLGGPSSVPTVMGYGGLQSSLHSTGSGTYSYSGARV
eukprot:tig00000981_g5861.t1